MAKNVAMTWDPGSNPVPLGIPGVWQYQFGDDFTGSAVDEAQWQVADTGRTWGVISSDPPIGHSTRSLYENTTDFGSQNWDDSQIAVSSSVLTLTADSSGLGGLIISRWALNYGAYESQVRFTGGAPAIWIAWHGDDNDANGTNEFDGIEIDWAEAQFWDGHSNYLTSNVHWGGYGPTHEDAGSVAYSTDGAWHKIGLLWAADSVKIYYDGTLVRTIADYAADVPAADPRKHYMLISNCTPGSGIAEFDYVRHWTGV